MANAPGVCWRQRRHFSGPEVCHVQGQSRNLRTCSKGSLVKANRTQRREAEREDRKSSGHLVKPSADHHDERERPWPWFRGPWSVPAEETVGVGGEHVPNSESEGSLRQEGTFLFSFSFCFI